MYHKFEERFLWESNDDLLYNGGSRIANTPCNEVLRLMNAILALIFSSIDIYESDILSCNELWSRIAKPIAAMSCMHHQSRLIYKRSKLNDRLRLLGSVSSSVDLSLIWLQFISVLCLAELFFGDYCAPRDHRRKTRDAGNWVICSRCARWQHKGWYLRRSGDINQMQPKLFSWCIRTLGRARPDRIEIWDFCIIACIASVCV